MGSNSSYSSPEIPEELKSLYVDAVKNMRQGMADMPMSDFYEMPARQYGDLSNSEQRAMGAVGNLYDSSPALNRAYDIANNMGNIGPWQGADLSQIGAQQGPPPQRNPGPPRGYVPYPRGNEQYPGPAPDRYPRRGR